MPTRETKKATKNRVVGGGGGEINRAKQLNSIHHQKACNKTKKVKRRQGKLQTQT